jgi:hypothetical protein
MNPLVPSYRRRLLAGKSQRVGFCLRDSPLATIISILDFGFWILDWQIMGSPN